MGICLGDQKISMESHKNQDHPPRDQFSFSTKYFLHKKNPLSSSLTADLFGGISGLSAFTDEFLRLE